MEGTMHLLAHGGMLPEYPQPSGEKTRSRKFKGVMQGVAIFLLGVLTRKANETGVMIGMACGFATDIFLWLFPLPSFVLRALESVLGHPAAGTKLAWTWYVLVGTAVTFGVGYLASLAFAQNAESIGKETHA